MIELYYIISFINHSIIGPNLKQLLTNSILDQKFNNASVIDTKKLINIDQELVQLWDFLGVNIEYRTIFIQKISYFNESIQTQIISFEKDLLVKVSKHINVTTFNLLLLGYNC